MSISIFMIIAMTATAIAGICGWLLTSDATIGYRYGWRTDAIGAIGLITGVIATIGWAMLVSLMIFSASPLSSLGASFATALTLTATVALCGLGIYRIDKLRHLDAFDPMDADRDDIYLALITTVCLFAVFVSWCVVLFKFLLE